MLTLLAASTSNPAGGAAIGDIVLASAGAMVITTALFALGIAHRAGRTQLLARPADWAARVSDLPRWVALPSGVVTASLITAVLGMYWDISLHIDVGRDPGPLANPAHYLILAGLFGIFAGGFLGLVLPEGRPSPTAIRIAEDWHVPLGAAMLTACGAFALIAFPLDDAWHRMFGQDVTLWGPTHLMLIGGASLSLVGQAVLLVEGTRAQGHGDGAARESRVPHQVVLRRAALAGAFLVGCSTFQAEFDFGVPQFAFIFQPLLIALAAGVALVSARVWAGRGGALAAVAFFLGLRGLVALVVGGVFGETTPHFPLYVVEALLIEAAAAWLLTRRPLAFGAVAGLLAGTVGFAAEWGWSHVWMPLPWPSSMLGEAALVAALAGLAGGVIGVLIGLCLRSRPQPLPGSARVALAAAAAAIVALVGFGLNTHSNSDARAQLALRDVPGQGGRAVQARITVSPRDAADHARWLMATAWQGGGLVVDRLHRVREGVYETTKPLPVHGDWKTLVRFHTGHSLLALPIYLPNDPAIPAREVPARSGTRPFGSDHKLLQREAKPGAAALTVMAYGTVLAIAAALLALLAWGLARMSRDGGPPARPERMRARPPVGATAS